MILTVSIALPRSFELAPTDRIEILDSEVRDPAAGVIGHVLGQARMTWRAGHRYLEVTIDVDDAAAIAASTRSGGSVF